MNNAMLLVVPLLVLAPHVVGAAEKIAPAAKAEQGAASAKKGDKKNGAKEPAAPAAKKEPELSEAAKKRAALKAKKAEPPENAQQRAATLRAKSVFLFAMDTCDRPERCDPALRDDAERKFLDQCRVCAPVEKCEAERDAIRAGTARRRANPCDVEDSASAASSPTR